MQVKITYTGTLNGVKGIWCGIKPNGAIITKEICVLYPKEKQKLRKKGTEELLDFVILKEDDTQENYEEVEKPKDAD